MADTEVNILSSKVNIKLLKAFYDMNNLILESVFKCAKDQPSKVIGVYVTFLSGHRELLLSNHHLMIQLNTFLSTSPTVVEQLPYSYLSNTGQLRIATNRTSQKDC